ncbi:TOBE domain-containing protein [Reyranella sp.]|nr:TOBE domain-containing protein [Reyranella sp.]HQT13298.1 TOBE domain-containing protein [Reyranella sp.]
MLATTSSSPAAHSLLPPSVAARRPHLPAFGPFGFSGRIAECAYLGNVWDYDVALDGGQLRLRAITTPGDIFEVGDVVSGTIDAKAVAMVVRSLTNKKLDSHRRISIVPITI